MSEESRKSYIIRPIYKKSALEKQEWVNTLSNGKSVTVLICNLYRWASFTIELTDKEKEEVLNKDEIILGDYEFELIEMCDGGCDFYVDICGEESYSNEEKEEIDNLIYKYSGEVPEFEDEDDSYSEDKMEHNGWCETDCHYILGKCELDNTT